MVDSCREGRSETVSDSGHLEHASFVLGGDNTRYVEMQEECITV